VSSKAFEERIIELQRTIFRSERDKATALAELRRIGGDTLVATLVALAATPRADCKRCGCDYMVDEIGESGMCSDCFDKAETEQTEG
jgi:predicted Zn-ribbon and HTH transcriptional regulator